MKRLSLLLLAIALLATPAVAERIELSPGESAFALEVLESNLQRTVWRLDLSHFDLETVSIAGEDYVQVLLGKRALLLDKGLPALPVVRESILIPDDAAMGLRILSAEYREFADLAVVPSKGSLSRQIDPSLVAYTFDDFYGGDAWYPTETAALGDAYIMRDTRGVVVSLQPFSFNPASRVLRVCTSLTVEIAASGPGLTNVLTEKPAARVNGRANGRHNGQRRLSEKEQAAATRKLINQISRGEETL